MADRFFTELPLAVGEFQLTGAEAHHLAVVRRFEAGDRVVLFNGDGCDYPAVILDCGKKSTMLSIPERVEVDRELPFPLTIAAALPKGDRADFLIEKLTELGVTTFVPLTTARSIVVPKPAMLEKFRRQVIEASKQCGRNRLMTIAKPESWPKFLERTAGRQMLFHTVAASVAARSGAVATTIAIGPEGGFTSAEVQSAIIAGREVVQFGPRTLRLETAAIVAAISAISGSWWDDEDAAS